MSLLTLPTRRSNDCWFGLAGVVERAGAAVRGGGRGHGAAGAVPGPAVRAHARVLDAPPLRAPHLPAAGGRPGAARHALLPPPQLLPLAAGPGVVRPPAICARLVTLAFFIFYSIKTSSKIDNQHNGDKKSRIIPFHRTL